MGRKINIWILTLKSCLMSLKFHINRFPNSGSFPTLCLLHKKIFSLFWKPDLFLNFKCQLRCHFTRKYFTNHLFIKCFSTLSYCFAPSQQYKMYIIYKLIRTCIWIPHTWSLFVFKLHQKCHIWIQILTNFITLFSAPIEKECSLQIEKLLLGIPLIMWMSFSVGKLTFIYVW